MATKYGFIKTNRPYAVTSLSLILLLVLTVGLIFELYLDLTFLIFNS